MTTAWAQDGAAAAGLGGQIFGFLPIILIFVIFYFLVLKPQNDEAKKHAKLVAALKKGDTVVTQGGIWGVISGLMDTTVKIEIADGVEVMVSRISVVRVVDANEAKNLAKPAAAASSKKR